MKKLILSMGLVLLVVGLVFADTKMSNIYLLNYKINDKIDIFLESNTGIRENVEELNSYYLRKGITYHAGKNLDLGLSYLFLRNRTLADKWLNEQRPEIIITPKITIKGFRLSNRTRLEYRILEAAKDKSRCRNSTSIAYPIGTWIPSLSEEFFYNFKNRQIDVNWIILGLDKKINKNLTIGVFFNYETVRRGTTSNFDANNVLGTKIVYSF